MRESWGLTKPKGAMKVKVFALVARPRQDPVALAVAGALPARLIGRLRSGRRSKSVHAGTRKMVNYV